MTDNPSTQLSKRVEQHAAMLDEALRCPGVREVVEVCGAWQRIDEQLSAYRAATAAAPMVTTTDQANAR